MERVRAFAMDEVLPVANRLDPRHEDIPDSVLQRMGELGLFGVLIPEDEGGLGSGCTSTAWSPRSWPAPG